jgi:hypothetical protein
MPETGLLLASLKVTVIVDVVTPSAITEVGEAVTVEVFGSVGPAGPAGTTLRVPSMGR